MPNSSRCWSPESITCNWVRCSPTVPLLIRWINSFTSAENHSTWYVSVYMFQNVLPLLHSFNTHLKTCKIHKVHVSFHVWVWLINLRDKKTTMLENAWEPCWTASPQVDFKSSALTIPGNNVPSATTKVVLRCLSPKPLSKTAAGQKVPAAVFWRCSLCKSAQSVGWEPQ